MERPRTMVSATVIGTPDPRRLADFYERLLGWPRKADEPDWVMLRAPTGAGLSFQQEDAHTPPRWPAGDGEQQMQMHLDIGVEELAAGVAWACACGATLAEFQPQADVRVLLDPDGHPFCLFPVAPEHLDSD